ncbi:MAG: UDP-N-acetylmuramoyl-tripeptide--D-alanyl-D-alanine ligase [Bacteroidetes bacterium]|nr:UDP-N-acetylmuramoyl-tripeptide--D-alanyl-D-alanine ligase [Bacteroidota bacterium]
MTLRLADILRIPLIEARNLGAADNAVRDVVTDSRSAGEGDVFVAFRGARIDAHDFVPEVCARGALCCVVEQRWLRRNAAVAEGLPLVVVRDTMAAYGAIAALHRAAFDIPLLAITGSNGKTSSKEMTAAALGTKYRVLANEGNLNNHIGLPATLLRITREHQVVITEMGTNQPGDIAHLCAVARPTHGLITNIGRAHIEKLESREGIAKEKKVLLSVLPKGGVAIINADEALLRGALPRGVRRVRYGTRKDSDVRIVEAGLDADGRAIVRFEAPAFVRRPFTLRLQALGRHAAYNAAAALAAGFVFGCGVKAMTSAIESVASYDKRLQIARVRGVTVIDDTYNANPDSVLAAMDLLQQLEVEGARCVVLGDMLELGAAARQEHEAIGAAIAAAGIPYVLTFGRHSRAISRAAQGVARVAMHFTDRQALIDAVDALLEEGDAVLVKGSRSMRMEDVVTQLLRNEYSEEARV